MPEMLTTQLVAELLQKLLVAFPRNLGMQNPAMMADVYRNGLRGLDGDAIRAAVDVAIQHDTYFPKIARLRELASEWTRRNRPPVALRIPPAWDQCPTCGARAVLKGGERQARGSRLELLWDGETAEGKPIPKMEPWPDRYVIAHDPARHGIRQDADEAIA